MAIHTSTLRLGFRGRIIALLVIAICLVQLLTLAVVQVVTERAARAQLGQQLEVAARVWQRSADNNTRQLLDSVAVLADDFGFKAAVASGDLETMQSALINQGSRLGVRFAALFDLDGKVTATLVPAPGAMLASALAPALAQAERAGQADTAILFDGVAYRVAVVPVLAPLPIGWLAMGTKLDSARVAEFQHLTGVDASVIGTVAPTLTIFASSLPSAKLETMKELPAALVSTQSVRNLELAGAMHFILARPLSTDTGQLAVLLQGSLAEAMAPYASMRNRILLLTALFTLVALLIAVRFGQSVTRPVATLADAANRVGEGDYEAEVRVTGHDELAALGRSFERMRKGIAEREATIRHQANHDSLTGLPNRRRAIALIDETIANHQMSDKAVHCAVLVIDINRFKQINDSLGHQFGDEVLVEIARRLCAATDPNGLAVRLGGDEFLVVLTRIDPAHIRSRAGAVLQALREPLRVRGVDVNLDASIGVATAPTDGDGAEALLRRADIAMYDAKDDNAGVASYRHGREQKYLRRLALMSDLRGALERDQFHLVYQPKIDLATQQVVHAEALLRWQHPELGAISPEEFIPLAEHSGSMHDLTHFVLSAALAENARWREQGLDLAIAVNVSALDLMDPGLVDCVEDDLAKYRVPATRLILEVTESALMRDIDLALRVLRRMNALGVQLAIDDYGTGYSSLAQLKRLPVSELKIDKSFVSGLEAGSDDQAIVRSTIDLGHNLGLRVVAEGVESATALAMLHELGCDMAQGYLLSRPLRGVDFIVWCSTVDRKQWSSDPTQQPGTSVA